jgi:hypothetical protein
MTKQDTKLMEKYDNLSYFIIEKYSGDFLDELLKAKSFEKIDKIISNME